MQDLSFGGPVSLGGSMAVAGRRAGGFAMPRITAAGFVFAGAALVLLAPAHALAHGFAGKRFFPATIATDDPFVADELSLPTVSSLRHAGEGDEPEARETEISVEFAKRITEHLGLSVEAPYVVVDPKGEPTRSGFNNLWLALRYQFLKSAEHEAVASAELAWDIGGSGSRKVDAERFSTLTPAVFFGKGLGDLPEDAGFLRPLAVTGFLGVAMPTASTTRTAVVDETTGGTTIETTQNPNVLVWGGTIQYSLRYLESYVKDVGLGAPFNGLTPIVELQFETPLDRGGGETTGTVNPGVLWTIGSVQLGLEAEIPINDATGLGTGVRAQLHFYLDDLFPTTIGRPLIAR